MELLENGFPYWGMGGGGGVFSPPAKNLLNIPPPTTIPSHQKSIHLSLPSSLH